MKKTIISTSMLVSLGLFFTGCGSNKFHSISPNYMESMKSDNNTLVVIDSCIKSDYTGEDSDNWSVYKSKKVNEVLSSTVKDVLETKGFKINEIISPSMCGYFKKPSLNVNIQLQADQDLLVSNLPYSLDDKMDKELKDAIVRVTQASYLGSMAKTTFNQIFKIQPFLKNDLELIKNKTNQDKILVFNNLAIDVSAGKSIGQALTSTILTLGLYTRYNVDSMVTAVALIDIEKEEIIWKTGVKIKDPDLYSKDWYMDKYKKMILDPITEEMKN